MGYESHREEWDVIEDQLNCLSKLAKERFYENTHRDPWYNQEPRWHIYKCIDQLSIASYHYRNGDYLEYEVNLADALNHMMFAVVTLGNDYGGCHPVMR